MKNAFNLLRFYGFLVACIFTYNCLAHNTKGYPADQWLTPNRHLQEVGLADSHESGALAKDDQGRALVVVPPQEQEWGDLVPADFDWQAYVSYHPKLRDMGIASEARAREHYATAGRHQRLVYRRLRVTMRYTACTGLINQLYSHISAISLGIALGAEIVLPPAAVRDSFAHYFSVFKERNEVAWTPAPVDSLLDADGLIDFWGRRGVLISKGDTLEGFPDLTQPEMAYVDRPFPGIDPGSSARLGGVYARYLDLGELVGMARDALIRRAEETMRGNGSRMVEHALLDLPCTFFMLRTPSNLQLVEAVAGSLQWPAKLRALAERVQAGMREAGGLAYNSVHFRIEKDAKDWAQIMGGVEVVWEKYIEAMKLAGFNQDQGLYIASGLLTYGASAEMDSLVSRLKKNGLCKSAFYKELFIPESEINELNSEQKALLDFLVLYQGDNFVGFGSSTFSFYLREFRSVKGVPKSKSILVDASAIGTDHLFAEAARIS